jgi:hypothetical protein
MGGVSGASDGGFGQQTHECAGWLNDEQAAKVRDCLLQGKLTQVRPSRAVGRNGNIGRRQVSGVRLDGLHDEIEFVGAVDFPGHAVVLAWRDDLGFAEVVKPSFGMAPIWRTTRNVAQILVDDAHP